MTFKVTACDPLRLCLLDLAAVHPSEGPRTCLCPGVSLTRGTLYKASGLATGLDSRGASLQPLLGAVAGGRAEAGRGPEPLGRQGGVLPGPDA